MRDYVTAGGTTTYFLYDGSSPVLEETYSASSGTTTIQVANGFADGWRERAGGGGFNAYAFDPQGTLQGEDVNSNTLRTAVNTYVYDGYGRFLVGLHVGTGQTTGYNQDPVQFGGQSGYYTDVSTGEVDLTHRYYDPSTGHFLNRDPIGYNGGQNLYAFCGNNPITGSDPNGTQEPDAEYDPAEAARDDEYNPGALDYNWQEEEAKEREAENLRNKINDSMRGHSPLAEPLQSANPVAALLYGAPLNATLPGKQGVAIPRRPTGTELENLQEKFGVEFAVTYQYGPYANGKGGQYFLYSGEYGRVPVPIAGNVMLIAHTQPNTTANSEADVRVLELAQKLGSPQKSSVIYSGGWRPMRYGSNRKANLANLPQRK